MQLPKSAIRNSVICRSMLREAKIRLKPISVTRGTGRITHSGGGEVKESQEFNMGIISRVRLKETWSEVANAMKATGPMKKAFSLPRKNMAKVIKMRRAEAVEPNFKHIPDLPSTRQSKIADTRRNAMNQLATLRGKKPMYESAPPSAKSASKYLNATKKVAEIKSPTFIARPTGAKPIADKFKASRPGTVRRMKMSGIVGCMNLAEVGDSPAGKELLGRALRRRVGKYWKSANDNIKYARTQVGDLASKAHTKNVQGMNKYYPMYEKRLGRKEAKGILNHEIALSRVHESSIVQRGNLMEVGNTAVGQQLLRKALARRSGRLAVAQKNVSVANNNGEHFMRKAALAGKEKNERVQMGHYAPMYHKRMGVRNYNGAIRSGRTDATDPYNPNYGKGLESSAVSRASLQESSPGLRRFVAGKLGLTPVKGAVRTYKKMGGTSRIGAYSADNDVTDAMGGVSLPQLKTVVVGETPGKAARSIGVSDPKRFMKHELGHQIALDKKLPEASASMPYRGVHAGALGMAAHAAESGLGEAGLKRTGGAIGKKIRKISRAAGRRSMAVPASEAQASGLVWKHSNRQERKAMRKGFGSYRSVHSPPGSEARYRKFDAAGGITNPDAAKHLFDAEEARKHRKERLIKKLKGIVGMESSAVVRAKLRENGAVGQFNNLTAEALKPTITQATKKRKMVDKLGNPLKMSIVMRGRILENGGISIPLPKPKVPGIRPWKSKITMNREFNDKISKIRAKRNTSDPKDNYYASNQ